MLTLPYGSLYNSLKRNDSYGEEGAYDKMIADVKAFIMNSYKSDTDGLTLILKYEKIILIKAYIY